MTLSDPMDCNPPSSSVHGIWNARVGCHFLLQGIFPTQGSNLHLLCLRHWQVNSLPLSYLGSLNYLVAPNKTQAQNWAPDGFWWQESQPRLIFLCFPLPCSADNHIIQTEGLWQLCIRQLS